VGELTQGQNLKSRMAVAHSTMFMLRRVLYAAIMVYWIDRSYFQIQFMIFKSSLAMLYSGYFRPFELPQTNRIELMNEACTLLCTYSLITFSDFVPEAEVRYNCGWVLVVFVLMQILLNLGIIIGSSLIEVIRRCKLRIRRHRNIKAFKQRLDFIKQQKERQELAK